jgi:cytochrome c oxidase assembly protein subunit 11
MAKSVEQANRRSLGRILVVVVAMFGFGYLLVPLYNVFCDITGLNGKTGRIDEAAVAARYQPDRERWVKVQFVVNANQGMPWEVKPEQYEVRVHPGEVFATAFTASNPTGRDMVGQAVPSVAPGLANRYFNKTECFCFNKQELAAGERKEMPLRFVVDPALPRHINTLTLAYTFFDVGTQAVN